MAKAKKNEIDDRITEAKAAHKEGTALLKKLSAITGEYRDTLTKLQECETLIAKVRQEALAVGRSEDVPTGIERSVRTHKVLPLTDAVILPPAIPGGPSINA